MSVSEHKKADTGIDAIDEKRELHSEVLADKDLMSSALDGENNEHEETLWQSIKSHPMACFWAFVFCFTIVSDISSLASQDIVS